MWVVWEHSQKYGWCAKIKNDFGVRYNAEQWILKNKREGYDYDILPLFNSIQREIAISKGLPVEKW